MATFEELNGLTIQEAFDKFHQSNPDVYEMIKGQAFKAIRIGRTKISIKAIVNWIRWNIYVDVNHNPSTGYRINDAYISLYARKFVKDYPAYEDYIEMRKLRANKPPEDPPPPTHPRGCLF